MSISRVLCIALDLLSNGVSLVIQMAGDWKSMYDGCISSFKGHVVGVYKHLGTGSTSNFTPLHRSAPVAE
jgi:hypothetical protein